MRIFDAHVMLGDYPFRKVNGTDAEPVRSILASGGVTRALVSSLPAVFYRDVMQGNLALLEQIARHRDFFIPVAVLNPAFPGCFQDLDRCLALGFRVIRLYPAQHGYFLYDTCCVNLLHRAAELGLPVSVPASIENPLQRHRLDADRYIEELELVRAVQAAPATVVLFHHAATHLYAKAVAGANLSFVPKVYYDFQRVDFMAQDSFAQLFEYAGGGHIVFGSGCPLHLPDVQFLKLRMWNRFGDEHQLVKIAWNNLDALFSSG